MYTTSLVLLSLLAQLAPASTDPRAKAEAQGLLREGSALYATGDYAGALERFTAAYAAFPSPKLLFNIGQANRDLGRPVEALTAFEKFLADNSNASSETNLDARTSVAELQEKLGQIRIDCETTGAELSVDGKPVGLTPRAALLWATPGHHQVTASHPEKAPALADVDVTAGLVQGVTLRLRPLAIAADALPVPGPEAARPPVAQSDSQDIDLQASSHQGTTSEGWWLGRKWTWVAAGSTVLLASGAIGAGLAMQSRFDSLKKSCGNGSLAQSGCSESDISGVRSRQTMANVLWGLAGAAAVTAGVLFYVEGQAVQISPIAGEATGLVASMRY